MNGDFLGFSPSHKKIMHFSPKKENEASVATFLEADVNKIILRLKIIQNLDMHRIVVVLLQSILYIIITNQKLFIVIRQIP